MTSTIAVLAVATIALVYTAWPKSERFERRTSEYASSVGVKAHARLNTAICVLNDVMRIHRNGPTTTHSASATSTQPVNRLVLTAAPCARRGARAREP